MRNDCFGIPVGIAIGIVCCILFLVFTLGVLYGATWMHGRCCRSAVDFGIEAMKQETVILAAFFTTIDQCAIHYAIDAVKARLTGRGRK